MTKYVLADKVVFDNEKNSLANINNESDCVMLPTAVNRCLTALIHCKGAALSKKDIMHIGWGKYGTVVADGSLWQAMSQLRRAFDHFGLDEQVIITVPRVGYQLSSAISVEHYPQSRLSFSQGQLASRAAKYDDPAEIKMKGGVLPFNLVALKLKKSISILFLTPTILLILFPIVLILFYK